MHITSRDMVSRLQGEVADKAKLERILKIEAKESEVKVRFVWPCSPLLLCGRVVDNNEMISTIQT